MCDILRELGQFAADYPGTLDALFAAEKFREVMRSMLRYRYSLEGQRDAERAQADRKTMIKWGNSVFIEHLVATTELENVIHAWETEIVGEKKSIAEQIRKTLKMEQSED